MSEPKSTLQILKEARELLSDEKRWTRHYSARDANGQPADPLWSNAVCFCSYGALERVTGDRDSTGISAAERSLRAAAYALTGRRSITAANDLGHGGHTGVLKLFDSAIAQETLAERARAVSP